MICCKNIVDVAPLLKKISVNIFSNVHLQTNTVTQNPIYTFQPKMSWFLSLDSLDIYLSQASTKGTVTQNLEEKMMPKGHNKLIDGRVFHAKVGPK